MLNRKSQSLKKIENIFYSNTPRQGQFFWIYALAIAIDMNYTVKFRFGLSREEVRLLYFIFFFIYLFVSITIYKKDSPFCVHFLKYRFYPLNIIIY